MIGEMFERTAREDKQSAASEPGCDSRWVTRVLPKPNEHRLSHAQTETETETETKTEVMVPEQTLSII
jgi:hypothetical protein